MYLFEQSSAVPLGLILALTVAILPLHGATLIVAPAGGDYTSIQAAIDAASAGDEVVVECGTYFENVTLKNGVHLRGRDPRCAIVDARFDGDVVTIPPVTQETIVEGLTIRHGRQTIGGSGAGVRIIGPGAPVVTRNIIEENGTGGSGVGVEANGAFSADDAPVITRNVIRGNESCCFGGGVSLNGTTNALVAGNLIAGNSAYYGGGIYAYYGVTIANNTIVNNDAWLGGGVASFNSIALINNLIADNVAVIYGGGVFIVGADEISNNDVFGNTPENWVAPSGDLTGVNGNISVAPRLVDPQLWTFDGVQPRSTSPLVDAGASFAGPIVDLRGIPRPLDGDVDGVPRVDIGARENEGVTGVLFEPGEVLVWDYEGEMCDLYRGDLAVLRATGAYTQHPDDVPGAAVECMIAQPGPRAQDPEPGQIYFYLIAIRGPSSEGSLGFASNGTPRPSTYPGCDL